jgi:hypothetical protein
MCSSSLTIRKPCGRLASAAITAPQGRAADKMPTNGPEHIVDPG